MRRMMLTPMRWPLKAVAAACLAVLRIALAAPADAADAEPVSNAPGFKKVLVPFLNQHCHECHDAGAKEGGLDLTGLAPAFADGKTFAVWAKVYQRVKAGEMPPKRQPQPTDESRAAAIGWVEEKLLAAEKEHRELAGPRGLRRLNRIEYQNTIHDLLAVEVPLIDLLPVDGDAEGFDNVAGGLSISPLLMQRYMEAADVAMDAAIVHTDAPQTGTQRILAKDGKSITEGIRKNQYLELTDQQAFVKFYSSGSTTLDNLQIKTAGRYRFRIECWPYQPDGKTPAMAVYVISTAYWATGGRGGDGLVGYFDVSGTAEEPAVVRFETTIGPQEVLRVEPYGLGSSRSLGSKKMSEVTSMGLAVRGVEVDGPLQGGDNWPPASHQRLFGDLPLRPSQGGTPVARSGTSRRQSVGSGRQDPPGRGKPVVYSDAPKADADRLLRDFLPRALSRPVTDADAQPFIALAHKHLDEAYDFEQAMRVAYRAVLCSPQFLVINRAPAKRDDHAIASRLSYFLWSTMPDEALLKLADAGRLRDPAVLREQVERMLGDRRAAALTDNFLGQWLDLRQIEETTPDAKLYPEFDKLLELSMVRETQRFFEELLTHDLSVLNFIDSDFSMLNERLAKHYGIEGVKGYEQFRRVKLPPGAHRGGVLTQAAVLKVTADGTRTSPVLRGVWVLENILGAPTPPPDAVPGIDPDIRGATTIREQLARHSTHLSCAVCHVKIDPPGFALESFDPIGGWRTHYRSLGEGATVEIDGRRAPYRKGPAVDPSGRFDGRPFDDIDAFKKRLLDEPDQIARCVAGKLLIYATGRGLDLTDGVEIDRIVQRARAKNYGLRTLIHSIVQSDAFLDR